MKSRGFTLIELLVVIAIIAILAAILFPVFSQAREKARQTQCASNMKQITMALLQYAQDFDEMYPAQVSYAAGSGQYLADGAHPSWLDLQAPYLKSTNVGYCPDDPNAPSTSNNTTYPVASTSGQNSSYTINEFLVPRYYPTNPGSNKGLPVVTSSSTTYSGNDTGLAVSQIARPSNVILLTETTAYYVANSRAITPSLGTDVCWMTINWASVGAGASPTPTLRHSGGANYSFADGHVKWNSMQFVVGGTDTTDDCAGQVYFKGVLPIPGSATSWYVPNG